MHSGSGRLFLSGFFDETVLNSDPEWKETSSARYRSRIVVIVVWNNEILATMRTRYPQGIPPSSNTAGSAIILKPRVLGLDVSSFHD